jgi:hypothetical protein
MQILRQARWLQNKIRAAVVIMVLKLPKEWMLMSLPKAKGGQ